MSEKAPSSRCILLVEDSADIRETTRDLLEFSGYMVFEAAGGNQARVVLAERAVDLVLTDALMPDGDGHELVRYIRSDQRFSRLPVVMVSARAEKKDIEHAMDNGADQYLIKPYNAPDLFAVIEDTLARRTGPSAGTG